MVDTVIALVGAAVNSSGMAVGSKLLGRRGQPDRVHNAGRHHHQRHLQPGGRGQGGHRPRRHDEGRLRGLGRQTDTTDATNRRTTTAYDALGDVTATTDYGTGTTALRTAAAEFVSRAFLRLANSVTDPPSPSFDWGLDRRAAVRRLGPARCCSGRDASGSRSDGGYRGSCGFPQSAHLPAPARPEQEDGAAAV